jgi:hypothetical protein
VRDLRLIRPENFVDNTGIKFKEYSQIDKSIRSDMPNVRLARSPGSGDFVLDLS